MEGHTGEKWLPGAESAKLFQKSPRKVLMEGPPFLNICIIGKQRGTCFSLRASGASGRRHAPLPPQNLLMWEMKWGMFPSQWESWGDTKDKEEPNMAPGPHVVHLYFK